MAVFYPDLGNIKRLKVPATPGELELLECFKDHLDDSYEIYFNPYLDGDRPDFIILKEDCRAFVIEVKDWNLKNYQVSDKNKWRVLDNVKKNNIASPHSQAFRYKKNLYDLHLPVVGIARLTNPNFFNLINCFVYFHDSTKNNINDLYGPAELKLKDDLLISNKTFRDKRINFESYEKKDRYLSRIIKNIQRDKSISFGSDRLTDLIKKIKKESRHVLFDEKVYQDFKRRLSPSENTLNQGIPIDFDKKQLGLTKSVNAKAKIKGVAGCGKTSILSQRAINANQRTNTDVLILTFNITLKNYIKDKISHIQGNRNFDCIEISNYHQFYNSQVNNVGQDIKSLIDLHGIQELYSIDIFREEVVHKYQTILVDEIQDYKSDWVKIIRDNFLHEDGEMILFGDESQDIYHRRVARAPVIAQGFGEWVKLNRSYRTNYNSPLNQLFKDFQLSFIFDKNSDIEIIDVSPKQMGMGFSLLKYEEISNDMWLKSVFEKINDYIRLYELHPNDLVILSSKIFPVRQLNELIMVNEKTHCMFETYEELAVQLDRTKEELIKLDQNGLKKLIIKDKDKDKINRVRRTKKNHFYANSGKIQLSTIHSYKGLEAKTVFYLFDKQDDIEVIYTSITRSSENLIIFDIGFDNVCSSFFKKSIGKSI